MTSFLEHRAIRLLSDLASDDHRKVATAELNLERLFENDVLAQRAALWMMHALRQNGRYSYVDYVWRIAEIVRAAMESGTLRRLLAPEMWSEPSSELAEVVCVLRMMSAAGESKPMIEAACLVSMSALSESRKLHYMKPEYLHPLDDPLAIRIERVVVE